MSNRRFFQPPKGEEDKHAYQSRFERRLKRFLTPFDEFTQSQITASAFLLFCALAAFIWASVPAWSAYYDKLTNLMMGFYIADFHFKQPLKFWINDLLLSLFFFIVGLEIKREFLAGELTNRKLTMLVVFAALGGMIVPGCIFLLFNLHSANLSGWGIPIATDTAFALGLMACFKKRLPHGVFAFIGALAILDDIGAILVIAFFYTPSFHWLPLVFALALTAVLAFLNYAGFRSAWPYLILGIVIWVLIEAAGIHGTIAGILVAFTIPARPRKGPKHFIERTKELLHLFEKRKQARPLILSDPAQHQILRQVQETAEQATTPLQRFAHQLELPIALLVLPLFALLNAGIPIQTFSGEVINRVSLGIMLGLFVGKPLGITLFSYLSMKLGLGELPAHTKLRDIFNVALFAGIGFTMSLFVSTLAFNDPKMVMLSKAGILMGSVLSGIVGVIFILLRPKDKRQFAL